MTSQRKIEEHHAGSTQCLTVKQGTEALSPQRGWALSIGYSYNIYVQLYDGKIHIYYTYCKCTECNYSN